VEGAALFRETKLDATFRIQTLREIPVDSDQAGLIQAIFDANVMQHSRLNPVTQRLYDGVILEGNEVDRRMLLTTYWRARRIARSVCTWV
jgi:hypothetical protein